MEDAKRSNSELFAESICAAEADEQDIAMSFDDLSGVLGVLKRLFNLWLS